MNTETLVIVGLALVASFVLGRRSAQAPPEKFLPGAIPEANFGKQRVDTYSEQTGKEIVGATIENFYTDTAQDPVYTVYNSINSSPTASAAPTASMPKYGPRSHLDGVYYDNTGVGEYRLRDMF